MAARRRGLSAGWAPAASSALSLQRKAISPQSTDQRLRLPVEPSTTHAKHSRRRVNLYTYTLHTLTASPAKSTTHLPCYLSPALACGATADDCEVQQAPPVLICRTRQCCRFKAPSRSGAIASNRGRDGGVTGSCQTGEGGKQGKERHRGKAQEDRKRG